MGGGIGSAIAETFDDSGFYEGSFDRFHTIMNYHTSISTHIPIVTIH